MAALEEFLQSFSGALAARSLAKCVLSKCEGADELQRVSLRTVRLKDGEQVSFVYSHRTRDVTKNLAPGLALDALRELLLERCAHAHLFTDQEEIQLKRGKRGTWVLHRRKSAKADTGDAENNLGNDTRHDREKERWVDIHAPFLHALGVTDADGRLIPSMARKWRQINKFVEVFDHALQSAALDKQALRVVDFGSGKGYLTFAVHEHLRHIGRAPQVTGVELRADLVRLCNDASERLRLEGLRFVEGDVQSHALGEIDVLIALHACDTATDQAMFKGIRAGAAVIMCSPCCHKEIRPQMHSPAALHPMLRHGIHLGQEAEMVTDTLRALLLEAEGYSAQVFEFVSLEHTSKNKMILAVKRPASPRQAEARAQIEEMKAFYGIRSQSLETLLQGDA